MTCPYCNADILNDAETCKFCGADVKEQKKAVEAEGECSLSDPQTSEIGMKWFKFLIYFLLFADAISKIVNAVTNLTGGISRGGIYTDYPVLKPVDIAFGIAAVAIAAYCIFTRFQLAKFKKNALKNFYSLQIIMLIFAEAYQIIYLVVIAGSGADVSIISTIKEIVIGIVSTVIYIVFSAFYFDRRKHLFVN